MRAITIWQPWATLIARGFKRHETRGWATKPGPIAIHAAAKWDGKIIDLCQIEELSGILYGALGVDVERLTRKECPFPLGAVVATANLVACHATTPEFVAGLSEAELAVGDFSAGRFAWELRDVVAIEPVPAVGKQGFWKWGEEKAGVASPARTLF